MVRRLLSSLAILLVGLVMPPVAAYAAWPQTPPNDPGFAPCENAATFTPNCYSDPGADQWDMFGPLSDSQYPCPAPILQHPDGGLPCWAVAAFDPDHMSGVNFTGPCRVSNESERNSCMSLALSILWILLAACVSTCITEYACTVSELISAAVPPYLAI